MLSRKNLIPLRKEFGRIRREGKLYSSESFGLVISYGKNLISQSAFVVSKKLDRRSVVRHEVKRKLSDGISPFLANLPKNLELVFLAKSKAIEKDLDQIKKEIEDTLRRARLLP